MSDCRVTDCCQDDLTGLTAVPIHTPEMCAADEVVQPCTQVPICQIAVALIDGRWMLSYLVTEVGPDDTVTITPSIGYVARNYWVSDVEVFPVGPTTYVLTATNDCGTTTASTVAYPATPIATLSSYVPESNCCTVATEFPSVSVHTANVITGGTVTLDLDSTSTNYATNRIAWGMPTSLPINQDVVVYLTPQPSAGTYIFNLTVTDTTGTYTDTETVVISSLTTSQMLTVTYTDCDYDLTWDATLAAGALCDGATLTIEGPGFGDGATATSVLTADTLAIDPTDYVDQIVAQIGDGGQWNATYTLALTSGVCRITQRRTICLKPKAVFLTCTNGTQAADGSNRYEFDADSEGNVTVGLMWGAYFSDPHGGTDANMGVVITNGTDPVSTVQHGTEISNGLYGGAVSVLNVTSTCTLFLVPNNATCGANPCQTACVQIVVKPYEALDCDPSNEADPTSGGYPIYANGLQIVCTNTTFRDMVAAYTATYNNHLYNSMYPESSGALYFDGLLPWVNNANYRGNAAKVISAYVGVGSYGNVSWSANQFMLVPEPSGGHCGWTFTIWSQPDTGVGVVAVTYRKDGTSAVGVYTLASNTYSWSVPVTITITEPGQPLTEENTPLGTEANYAGALGDTTCDMDATAKAAVEAYLDTIYLLDESGNYVIDGDGNFVIA